MKIKRGLLIVIGCIGVVFGAIGAILPLIPAFPFLLLATICFTKSSKRLNDWFVSTKLYKSNLMTVGFVMMNQVVVGRIVLGLVWLFHIIYFIFGIKTIKTIK